MDSTTEKNITENSFSKEGNSMIEKAQDMKNRIVEFLIECPCCTEEELQAALKYSGREVRRGLKLLEGQERAHPEKDDFDGEIFWNLNPERTCLRW